MNESAAIWAHRDLVAPRALTLELFFLGVDPAWGSGMGTHLLLSAEDHAREIGHQTLELWVINDNERALRVYERSGGSAPNR